MSLTARPAKLCALGTHRVLEPAGSLPQAAWKLDPTPVAYENEILCDVEVLNLDSASFRQIAEACGHDAGRVAAHLIDIVERRGKQHNPVTGSGGMFVGRVRAVGAALRERIALREGDRIASLVSLTLTPLCIEAVERVEMETGRIWVRACAILFETGLYALLPEDLPDEVALAVLDVAGAPAQVRRLAAPGMTVAVLGADGKSGLLACAQARERVGPSGRVGRHRAERRDRRRASVDRGGLRRCVRGGRRLRYARDVGRDSRRAAVLGRSHDQLRQTCPAPN